MQLSDVGGWYLTRPQNPRPGSISRYLDSPPRPIFPMRLLFKIYKFPSRPQASLEWWTATETSWVLLNGIKYWICGSALVAEPPPGGGIKFYAKHLGHRQNRAKTMMKKQNAAQGVTKQFWMSFWQYQMSWPQILGDNGLEACRQCSNGRRFLPEEDFLRLPVICSFCVQLGFG